MENVTVTPMNTIAITDNSKKCIETIINKFDNDTAIEFVQSLSGMDENQVKSFIFLTTGKEEFMVINE